MKHHDVSSWWITMIYHCVWYRFGIILSSAWDRFGIISGPFPDRFGSSSDHAGVILEQLWDHVGIILGPFGDHLGIILESSCDHLGIIFGSSWDHVGIILGAFWNNVGTISESFWDHLGIIFVGINSGPSGEHVGTDWDHRGIKTNEHHKKQMIKKTSEPSMNIHLMLNHARGGKFYYNSYDHGYTMDKYKEIRIVPKNCSDGCVWIFYVVGGTINEMMWCRTYFTSECNGWLSKCGGPCASQTWYVGEYPNMVQYVPIRFVDGSTGSMIEQVDSVSNKPIMDIIVNLTKSFLQFREETKEHNNTMKEREASLFKALTQRHDTDINTILENTKNIADNRCEFMEKNLMDMFKVERAIFDETAKIHICNVEEQLVGFEQAMEKEGTYRDSVYTDHVMATEKMVQDLETRTTDEQQRVKQDVSKMQEQTKNEVNNQISNIATDLKEDVVHMKEQVENLENTLRNTVTKEQVAKILFQFMNWRANDQMPELQNDDVLQLQLSNADEEPDWTRDKDEDELSWVEPEEENKDELPKTSIVEEDVEKTDEPSKTSITEEEIEKTDELPKILISEKKDEEVIVKGRSLTPLKRRRQDQNDRHNDRHNARSNHRDDRDRNDRRQEDKRPRSRSRRSRSRRNRYYPDVRDRKCSCPPKSDYKRRN